MCGIVGFFWKKYSGDRQFLVQNAIHTLRHRGPDGFGFYVDEQISLGHARLSIIDLTENGKQPVANEDGSLILICNGEIYNYIELKNKYLKAHQFKSNSDVEVILHLYEDYGKKCLEYLEGMFAFAIWDKKKKKIFLAKDRIGEKPLYYCDNEDYFVFASESKVILDALNKIPDINPQAVKNLLIYPVSPPPITFFNEIYQIEPASYMVYENHRLVKKQYWSLSVNRTKLSSRDAAAQFETIFRDTIKKTIRADVPIAVLLSGGIDSSSITYEAAKLNHDLTAFIVSDTSNTKDLELLRARKVAKNLNVNLVEIDFEARSISDIPKILTNYDQPIPNFAILYSDYIYATISKRVKVALTGNGADEIFGGYAGYNNAAKQMALIRFISFFSGFGKILGSRSDRLKKAIQIKNLNKDEIRAFFVDNDASQLSSNLFEEEFLAEAKDYSPGDFIKKYTQECKSDDYLDTVLYSDLMVYHTHGHTVMSDIAGMANSLEVRSPFLNHKLIEFAFSLPMDMLIPNIFNPDKNKYILRKYVAKNIDPQIAWAKKMGFGYTYDIYGKIKGPWRKAIESYVRRGRYRELGYFSKKGIDWAYENSLYYVWVLFIFSIWAEMYIFGEKDFVLSEKIQNLVDKES